MNSGNSPTYMEQIIEERSVSFVEDIQIDEDLMASDFPKYKEPNPMAGIKNLLIMTESSLNEEM